VDDCDWLTRAGLWGTRLLYDAGIMARNIPEMMIMIGHILVSGSRIVLRMMLADATLAAGACVEAA